MDYIICTMSKQSDLDYWVITSGGRFKNTYELLNLGALKFSHVNKIHIFQCMGKMFCVGTFEIPHKLSYPYIERYDFYTTLKF